MSGKDERPIEIYTSEKEEFKCFRCHGPVICLNTFYPQGAGWYWSYRCLECGYEGIRKKSKAKFV